MNPFVASIYGSRKAVPLYLFDFDFEQTSKFTLDGSNNVLSYLDRGITFLPYHTGASDIKLQADGVRVGSGTFNDSGSCLAANQTLNNLKEIFLVVAQGRNGTSTSTYNRVVFSTKKDSSTSGTQVQLSSQPNVRSNNLNAGTNLLHTMKRIGTGLTEATVVNNAQPTLGFGALNVFKILRLTISSHSGEIISLGKFFNGTGVSLNGIGGAHPIFKRVILVDCTPAQGDVIYSDLRTQYGI